MDPCRRESNCEPPDLMKRAKDKILAAQKSSSPGECSYLVASAMRDHAEGCEEMAAMGKLDLSMDFDKLVADTIRDLLAQESVDLREPAQGSTVR